MSDEGGWVKIYRSLLNNPIVMKDTDHIGVWIWLLLNATHKPYDTLFGGKRIKLRPGQLVAGRKKIAEELGIEETKVKRIMREFKSDQQIAQLSTPYGSLISILNWHRYQDSAQQNAQQMPNKCPTSAQPVPTIQEYKEDKEVVVDARARASGSRWLSDRLSGDEWNRLDRQFDLFLELIDRIDDQVTDPDAIESPYAYFLRAANNLNWPRK